MKKNLLLLILVVLFSSCVKNEENAVLDLADEIVQAEEAFPDVEKELYTTASTHVVEKLDSMYILQSDMLLTPEQIAVLDDPLVTRGAITSQLAKYWPNNTVAYDFASDFTYQNYVQQAFNDISRVTAVNFVERATGDHIHFIHGSGNYSTIGRKGGSQDISIQKGQSPAYLKGIIIHEVCHALGLFHEQSRSDRDKYIDILWDNIQYGKEHNFKTYEDLGLLGRDVVEFNLESIMMYGPTSFGKVVSNVQQPTIRKKDGSSYSIQRSYLAQSDIDAIQAIYGPPYMKVRTEIEVLQDQQFYGDELYEANYHVYVDFYLDKACTKPVVLTSPRFLSIRYYEEENSIPCVDKTYGMTAPAGVSSFFVGTGYLFWHEIQGGSVGRRRIEYIVLNV